MPKSKRVTNPHLLKSLVGCYFLTLEADGDTGRQGQVVAELPDAHYMVEFYSFLHGGQTYMSIFHIRQMVTESFEAERFIFFRNPEEWRDFADENRAKYMRQKGQ